MFVGVCKQTNHDFRIFLILKNMWGGGGFEALPKTNLLALSMTKSDNAKRRKKIKQLHFSTNFKINQLIFFENKVFFLLLTLYLRQFWT